MNFWFSHNTARIGSAKIDTHSRRSDRLNRGMRLRPRKWQEQGRGSHAILGHSLSHCNPDSKYFGKLRALCVIQFDLGVATREEMLIIGSHIRRV